MFSFSRARRRNVFLPEEDLGSNVMLSAVRRILMTQRGVTVTVISHGRK